MVIQFKFINEAHPDSKWQLAFNRVWPSYKKWFLSQGEEARTDLQTCRSQLSEYMPELLETFDRLCDLTGNDDLTSRFLSMVDPPKYLAGCSQLAWTGSGALLFRNYDFDPNLFEGVVTRTEWVRTVIGVSEGTWGLLDGMNDDGLAICLSFGGRKVSGSGFGIPLVVRYLLETCGSVSEACERVQKVPVHMAYSITMLDKDGSVATVHLSPDRKPVVTAEATCSNHQGRIEWNEYASVSQSVERKKSLDVLLGTSGIERHTLTEHFLQPPLYNDQFHTPFGTLYTAVYDPIAGNVQFLWPRKNLHIGFHDFIDQTIHVSLETSAIQTLEPLRDTTQV